MSPELEARIAYGKADEALRVAAERETADLPTATDVTHRLLRAMSHREGHPGDPDALAAVEAYWRLLADIDDELQRLRGMAARVGDPLIPAGPASGSPDGLGVLVERLADAGAVPEGEGR